MSDTAPQIPEMSDAEIEAEEKKIRMLKRIVAGLGILIVLGVLALVGGLIYKSSQIGTDQQAIAQTDTQTPAPVLEVDELPSNISLALPKGAVIEDITLNGTNLAVRWWQADINQNHIWILDLRSGEVVQRIAVTHSQ